MLNKIFKKQPVLLFPRKIQWRIWGSKFSFSLPRFKGDKIEYRDTNNQTPGLESLHFYDGFYDATTKEERDFSEQEFDPDRIEHPEEFDENIVASRRLYVNGFEVDIKDSSESFWFDIWIVRNKANGDLFDGANLKTAHCDFLKQKDFCPEIENPEEDTLFDNNNIRYTAINWHMDAINGLNVQAYEEHNTHHKVGASYIFPIGESHYIMLRSYRMRVSPYKEFYDAFERFKNVILKSFHARILNDRQCENNPEALANIQYDRYLKTDTYRNEWREREARVARENYEPDFIPMGDLRGRWAWLILMLIPIGVVSYFASLGYGAYTAYVYFDEHKLLWGKILLILVFFCLGCSDSLTKKRDQLKAELDL